MLGLLHGYFLEGSGSNLWSRAVARAVCRAGREVHLVCQENHPDRYDFIARAYRYHPNGERETMLERETAFPGAAVLHKPEIGTMLPVYVGDKYEEFTRVVRMPDLTDDEIEAYIETNARVVERVVRENGLRAVHANHVVLMPSIAARVSQRTGVPFAVMPHGSAIEYAAKRDPRMLQLASDALDAARRVFVVGPELRERVRTVFAAVPGIGDKLTPLNLGADTGLFAPVARGNRPAAITALTETLSDLPRGRTRAQGVELLEILNHPPDRNSLLAAQQRAAQYDGKLPDKDLEDQLEPVDWNNDPVLLYVGRLIAAKGVQSILAALPRILESHPRARLVLVGHGPLRETLELLLAAVARGDRAWVEFLIEHGALLEGTAARSLEEARGLVDMPACPALAEPGRVIFTGYLTHRELRHLFPCCDLAVFPSVVAEAGPLVFLEALASGVFPMGTYFAGMGASIDAIAPHLPAADAELMKIDKDPTRAAVDIAENATRALALAGRHRDTLRRIAVDDFDWQNVAERWAAELDGLSAS